MPGPSNIPEIRHRHLLPAVRAALTDTRMVMISGARQAGKSTLARLSVADVPLTADLTLDDEPTLAAAREDPAGFVIGDQMIFIDEIQRAPDLLLAIKAAVDRSNRPGQFLITGSANVLTLPQVADSLPGRREILELWPFSQGEIEGQIDGFVDRAFAGWPGDTRTSLTRVDYLSRAVRGGFPEVITRADERRRAAWFESYVEALVQRDVRDLVGIEKPQELRQLLRVLAARSGQLLNMDAVARDAQMSSSTARRYVRILQAAFIVKIIPGWATSKTTRAIRAPKVFFCDSGLMCHLLGVTAHALASPSAGAGPVLETFATMELARQLGWSQTRGELFHFRSKDGTEVDAVIEAADGGIVGVEVKPRATIRREDFGAMRLLREKVGQRFRGGLVLYTGAQSLSFGDQLRCVPMSSLWTPPGGQ